MFASSLEPRAKRRGIVLVVVLGMLGLMALIGVTFATFAGQSLIASRNFGQGVARPQAEALMDYALAQLINDTNNPVSAIRGHSLLRDMYGNDSVYRGVNPNANPAVETGGVLSSVYIQGTGTQATQFIAAAPTPRSNNTNPATPFYNQVQYTTNIPTGGQYYGLDFTRWIVTVQGTPATPQANVNAIPGDGHAAQTLEILEDDATGAVHKFTLSNSLTNPAPDPYLVTNPVTYVSDDWSTFTYPDANGVSLDSNWGYVSGSPPSFKKAWSSLARSWRQDTNSNYVPVPFVLDGRYMRAFNGPGLTQPYPPVGNTTLPVIYPYNLASMANFRVASLNPDSQGMDEDYDACDLENWFLAIQSADGQVLIPSFHRPGILQAGDWTTNPYFGINQAIGNPKILRPRRGDNSPLFPADPLPDSSSGKITYDIDNDGDGISDSVWLDLGYPVQRDPGGKLYKPLFAFMVLGLNGRLPLNTVGNLQARANVDTTNNMTAGPMGSMLPASTGQVPSPGIQPDSNQAFYKSVPNNFFFNSLTPGNLPVASSQAYENAPLYDHASHLGYSVNEINPKFALQNAPSNLYASATTIAGSNFSKNINADNFSQVDDAGVSVALTQMRNILAGTIPTDLVSPYPVAGLPINNLSTASANGDVNIVMVDGQAYILPNNMADLHDLNPNNTSPPYSVTRIGTPVPGRWGEPAGVNTFLPAAPVDTSGLNLFAYPALVYGNPVRAGRSQYTGGTNDVFDDDFDSSDPVLMQYLAATVYYATPGSYVASGAHNYISVPARGLPEFTDTFDTIGQRAVASERIRQFVTPIDPSGSGRIVDFMNAPNNDQDYGRGHDLRGRAAYFRYFRPAGMPQEIRYPYGAPGANYRYAYTPTLGGSSLGQQFLMPQLFPAGVTFPYSIAPTGASDVSNNRTHGFQSMLTPEIVTGAGGVTSQVVASMAAMPYDWDSSLGASGDVPQGYPAAVGAYTMTYPTSPPLGTEFVNTFAPTIDPNAPQSVGPQSYASNPLFTSVSTSYGPNLGLIGNPTAATPVYPIAYGNYTSTTDATPYAAPVVNGYLGGSLNKDEADEMNLYTTSIYDMPFGPSDLEWLYRLQDVDGATLNSRLSKLAPISFLNPADGLTRRRMFSTDSWDLTGFAYANDNPAPYAGMHFLVTPQNSNVNFPASSDHDFSYNSRFTPSASPSLEIMNQVDGNVSQNTGTYGNTYSYPTFTGVMANPITTEYLPNPTFPGISPLYATSFGQVSPNTSYLGTPIVLPTVLDTSSSGTLFDKPQIPRVLVTNGVVQNFGKNSMAQVQTPSLAHRDRKINLNMPLPISHDPGEPVRQKWVRETYQLLKAILPPSSVDTPEELAALSQFVVNVIDFRDPDNAMTRFVNTDLIVTDALTKSASNVQPTAVGGVYNQIWNASPGGVRFANSGDEGDLTIGNVTHFPFDPSLYNPDTTTPFLVQHGMEYSPIAINEVLAYQFQSGTTPTLRTDQDQGLFIELVNTLTEEQNNNRAPVTNTDTLNNASAVSLEGWDIVMTPDSYGWGRPDPISGDVSSIAFPPQGIFPPSTVVGPPPINKQPPFFDNSNFDSSNYDQFVKHFTFPAGNVIPGLNGNSGLTGHNYFIVGAYNNPTAMLGTFPAPGAYPPANAENNPIFNMTGQKFDCLLPSPLTTPDPTKPSFLPQQITPSTGKGKYYWLYLRRPANPFDISTTATNREMVVVDAMRFPFIEGGTATALNKFYSSRRLQPYRGGHLLRNPGVTTLAMADQPTVDTVKITTVCPPSPAHAYGYSEQMSPTQAVASLAGKLNGGGIIPTYHSINAPETSTANLPKDNDGSATATPLPHWSMFPFHDRDFTSVAELLLVPGCPPGLFTKQFAEEPYPGNCVDQTITTVKTTPAGGGPPTYATTVAYGTNYALGTDDYDISSRLLPTPTTVNPPTIYPNYNAASNPYNYTVTTAGTTTTIVTNTQPVGGRTNYGNITVNYPTVAPTTTIVPTPVAPTFPYLPDSFYYTGASVAPPYGGTLPSYYTNLTTEIGGWTGAGWHKMMEFFDVPSSANGAVGTADSGSNFDWARADIKPGLLNLNLLIDEEVFAGIFDDPRLNDRLAAYSSPGSPFIPQIATQVDGNGYPTASYSMFSGTSVNYLNSTYGTTWLDLNNNNAPTLWNDPSNASNNYSYPFGRGYSLKDPDSQNYTPYIAPGSGTYPYQQLHGLKAAFSDFLKLRHGGSGFLFAHGAGPVGSGSNFPTSPGWPQTQPVAADRPYRSMSYPDINYTVMRPASLPPTPLDTVTPNYRYSSTTPPLPVALLSLDNYSVHTPATNNGGNNTYVELSPVYAPRNTLPAGSGFQYIGDPGVKNPFLSSQYANILAPDTGSATANTPPTINVGGPPFAATATSNYPQAAPFPPPIPAIPARRLIQIPDIDTATGYQPDFPSSNASLQGSLDGTGSAFPYTINQQVTTSTLYSGTTSPPTLVAQTRAVFTPDNNTPDNSTSTVVGATTTYTATTNNYLGGGIKSTVTGTAPPQYPTTDYRQHPLYRTEWLQKIMNLTTVRTHQFAVWITVGFFEVVRPGTPELGIPDVLGQELGLTAGRNTRYRSFFTLDRTKATGFNPYYPGNFRDCVTYRRRIE